MKKKINWNAATELQQEQEEAKFEKLLKKMKSEKESYLPLPEKDVLEFMSWLKEEKREANNEAMGSASALNHGYSQAHNKIYSKAKKIFGIKSAKKR